MPARISATAVPPAREVRTQRDAAERPSLPGASLPKSVRGEIDRMVGAFRGPAAAVATQLLNRAVQARLPQLRGASAGKALVTLRAFAESMRGLDAATLRDRATVLDLKPGQNDSTFDAQTLERRRGAIRTGPRDDAPDNDGFLQRFSSSCGPAVLQMLMAEADPVLAFALTQSGRADVSARDGAAHFQRAVLEEFGGVGIPRMESLLASRLKNGLGQLVRSGELTGAQHEALVRHALARGPLSSDARVALEALRARYDGLPTPSELRQLRAAVLPSRDEGWGTDELRRALTKYASALTGFDYRATTPADGFRRGGAGKYLDAVERALKRGADVPFGISDPGHWMLLTDVRTRGAARQFLVSDPLSGRTAWVSEKDFASGKFASTQFHLGRPAQKPYLDSFVLPTAAVPSRA